MVSIIIPVYNVEKYLDKCLSSIMNQTYSNLEILIIDDGSTDNSASLCDEYANKDSRISVIHQKNRGLGAARNVGLDIAKGEYLMFVDSDDYLSHSKVVETLLSNVEKKYSAVYFASNLVNEFNDTIGERFIESTEKKELSHDELLDYVLMDRIGSQVWKAIYERQCWNDVRFTENRLYEDISTLYKAVFNMEKSILFLPEKLYSYRINQNGISLGGNIVKKHYHIFLGFKEQYEFALIHSKSRVQDKALANSTTNLIAMFIDLFSGKETPGKYVNDGILFFRNNIIDILKNVSLPIKKKIQVLLISYCISLYKTLYKVSVRRKKNAE